MRYETESTHRPGHPDPATDSLTRGLGLFSVALGVLELTAARSITRTLGLEGHERMVRIFGLREIISGIAILKAEDPTPWIWGRVAGDALDMGALMSGLSAENPKRANVCAALTAVAGVTALDLYCGQKLSSESTYPLPPAHDYSDRVGLPHSPEEMRGAARDFEIPRDMRAPEALRPYATV